MFFNKVIELILTNCDKPFAEDGRLKPHFKFNGGRNKRKHYLQTVFSALDLIKTSQEERFYAIRHKKSCPLENCANPQCYELIKRPLIFNSSSGKVNADIVELAEEIDYDRCMDVGPEVYLEEYNSGVPSFLKIDLGSLKTALTYIKHKRKDN